MSKAETFEDLAAKISDQDASYEPQEEKTWRKVVSHLEYPELKAHGRGKETQYKVLDTFENLRWLLEHFKAAVRYNLMNRKREIIIPDLKVFSDDSDNDVLAKIEYLATINDMPERNIDKWLSVLAGESAYHPIVDCVNSIPWDGILRWDEFLNTIESTQPELDKILIKTWMRSAIAAAYSQNGFIQHGVLVIQGPQGIGKTAWVKSLDPTNSDAIKIGALLEPKNKDSVIGISRFWLAELGELDGTFNKTDIAQLKSYITSDADYIRFPYGRKETRLARRTAYIATVNNTDFLVDDTGNRRWWTISANKINYEHDFDMQQVWAEVKHSLDNGGLTYLPRDIQSQSDVKNKSHEKVDPLYEKLMTFYDWSRATRKQITASSLLEEIGYSKPTKAETIRMGQILSNYHKENNIEVKMKKGYKLYEIPDGRILTRTE